MSEILSQQQAQDTCGQSSSCRDSAEDFFSRTRAGHQDADTLHPDPATALYNRGVIQYGRGEYEQALASYEQALAIRPGDVDTLYNLAFTSAKLGRFAQAALLYHEAIEQAPEDAELHNALGSVLRKLEEPELAATCYREAVSLRPDYGPAWTNLATLLHLLGRYEEALDCYRRAIELGDRSEAAKYMMAALSGSNQQTSPRSYVRELFDSYAADFDQSLVGKLQYTVPPLLKKICVELAGLDHRFRMAVDLGCGTGLAGEQFRELADQLIGVDLSGKMLEKAEARGVYDQLHCGEIGEFLTGGTGRDFDLILAADVLIYIGALESFFSQVRNRLEPGGYLLFSTEKLEAADGYQLQKTGRYAYSKRYLVGLAERFAFQVKICREVDLRKEKDQWLRGYLVALRRM